MSTKRRDALLGIQETSQAKWDAASAFELDAPDKSNVEDPKFLCTFPYPYSNGKLHLGHAFSLSKADFVTGYKRMVGKRALFPLGFHTTGMPIQACANKLKKEIELYGNPPVFPIEDEEEPETNGAAKAGPEQGNEQATENKGKATKGKLAAKASRFKYQWEILKESGVPEDIVAEFADPLRWLQHFPKEAIRDLKRFGTRVDWRRAFITTDANPYYDSFVRWQFNTLRSRNKVKFGKRYAVFSTVDNQACADHDRSSGEGIGPQEYTLIKMKLLEIPGCVPELVGRDVYLPAATLRPETMYGQTNCWVLPTGDYYAYEVVGSDVFICSEHSARNMAYQDILPEFGVVKAIAKMKGSDLIGMPLQSPQAGYDVIYVLPLLTVSMLKGTGIVTSVPSDAPDDYRGLMDLKEKDALRSKFNVKDEWVLPFEPVPIIDTPGFGNLAAVEACTKRKIRSQNDKDSLAKAKEEVYKAGFYSGTMLVGTMAGEPVQNAKPKIRDELIAAKSALPYSEPEGRVVDRNGEECVVALCDQWYLDYGETEWKAQTEKCLGKLETYADETRRGLTAALDWLREWACSRSFGLGTRLPWDEEWLIESLSDSTIYMAFYTVAHLLQGGPENMDGQKTGPLGIAAADMTDAAWDFVFFGTNETGLDVEKLSKLRKEFLYWYPVDLRTSGKDLIGNHLSFFLYNHVAIFPEEHWPAGIRVNGHVMLNAEKMSKSTGNFITLDQAIEKYTADGVRFALADASDTVEDANFSTKTADDAILKLSTIVDFIEEGIKVLDTMREGDLTAFADNVFRARLRQRVRATQAAYEELHFRDALKSGFYEFTNDLNKYREAVGADKNAASFRGLHKDLFLQYVEYQAIVLAPICPHTGEHIWALLRNATLSATANPLPELLVQAQWPAVEEPDAEVLSADKYLGDLLSRIRTAHAKPARKKKKAAEAGEQQVRDTVRVYVCKQRPEWQEIALRVLREQFNADDYAKKKEEFSNSPDKWWKFPQDTPKLVTAALPAPMKKNKKVMPFVAMLRKEVEAGGGAAALDRTLPFDEESVLVENSEFISAQLRGCGITKVEVQGGAAPENVAEPVPGEPGVAFSCSDAVEA